MTGNFDENARDIQEDDFDFLCVITEDEDVLWEYPLYSSTDPFIKWLINERVERSLSFDILGSL